MRVCVRAICPIDIRDMGQRPGRQSTGARVRDLVDGAALVAVQEAEARVRIGKLGLQQPPRRDPDQSLLTRTSRS